MQAEDARRDRPVPTLEAAVENAYRVFSDAAIGRRLSACRCDSCFGEDADNPIERALVATPLRAIPAKLLAEYTNSAHGWDDEMLYFLPRYLELIAAGDAPAYYGDPDYALARLAYADWRETWRDAERDAVADFFAALVLDRLRRPDAVLEWWCADGLPDPFYWASPLIDVLCMISNAGGDLTPLLALIDATPGRLPDLHIAAIVNDVGQRLYGHKLGWHTLGSEGATEAQIVAWLLRPCLGQRLEAAFFSASEPIDLSTLSIAVTLLDGARGSGADDWAGGR